MPRLENAAAIRKLKDVVASAASSVALLEEITSDENLRSFRARLPKARVDKLKPVQLDFVASTDDTPTHRHRAARPRPGRDIPAAETGRASSRARGEATRPSSASSSSHSSSFADQFSIGVHNIRDSLASTVSTDCDSGSDDENQSTTGASSTHGRAHDDYFEARTVDEEEGLVIYDRGGDGSPPRLPAVTSIDEDDVARWATSGSIGAGHYSSISDRLDAAFEELEHEWRDRPPAASSTSRSGRSHSSAPGGRRATLCSLPANCPPSVRTWEMDTSEAFAARVAACTEAPIDVTDAGGVMRESRPALPAQPPFGVGSDRWNRRVVSPSKAVRCKNTFGTSKWVHS
eukprot:jgi/Mesvir1/28843/Mv26449-RA.1